jgi:hypothetical protein
MENNNEIKRKVGRPATANGMSKHPNYVKEYNKNRYELNKETVLKNAKKKKHCDCCNVDISTSNFSKHCKSIYHNVMDEKYICDE